MKKILFDLSVCQPIGDSKFHGGGVYGYIVFRRLADLCPENLIVYINNDAFIPNDILAIIQEKNIETHNSSSEAITDLYNQNKFSVLYSPLWSDAYTELFPLGAKIIFTQHGLRALEMNRDKYEYIYARDIKSRLKAVIKQTFLFKYIQQKHYCSFQKALSYPNSRIITVSNHSKSSILYYYPFIDSSKITVCYSPETSDGTEPPQRQFDFEYYLLVSANRWLKNSFRAILAFDRIIDKQLSAKKMVVIGLKNGNAFLKKIKHPDSFVFLPYLDRADLEAAYKYAYCLIYPSLNEGFGYPPLEAMKYGVPVIASPLASIPEICGDAVLYANPYSVDEIAMRIIRMENKDFHTQSSVRALNRQKTIAKVQSEHLERLVMLIQNSIL